MKTNITLFLSFLFFNISLDYSQGQWAFMNGWTEHDASWCAAPRPSTPPTDVFGADDQFGASYKPGVREHAGGGIYNGRIYTYGGYGLTSSTTNDSRSDMWMFDISLGQWARVKNFPSFSNHTNQGNPDASAQPGTRNRMATAIDASGNLWLFGGYKNNQDPMNDLWKYNITTKLWTWVGGDNFQEGWGNANWPAARHRVRMWFDNNGDLWLYGGARQTSSQNESFNDLWKYNPGSNNWTCVKGNANQPYAYTNTASGVYPTTEGTGGPSYYPRARSDYGYWVDNNNNFWIFAGYAQSHSTHDFADLWKYNPTINEWTLVKGDNQVHNNSNPQNNTSRPIQRDAPYCWKGNDGNLYFFGGANQSGFRREVWHFDITTGTWVNDYVDNTYDVGPSINSATGVDHASNHPGAQVTAISHLTTSTHTYMFDGYGTGSNYTSSGSSAGFTGALNRYSLSSPCSPPSAPSIIASQSIACPTDVVTLTASGCAGTIKWYDNSTGTTKNVTGSGTFTAQCIVSGCSSTNGSVTVGVNSSCPSPCDSTLSWLTPVSSTCGGVTTRTVSVSGSNNVEYSTDGGSTWHLPNGSGTNYTLTFNDTNGVSYIARPVGCTNGSKNISGYLQGPGGTCSLPPYLSVNIDQDNFNHCSAYSGADEKIIKLTNTGGIARNVQVKITVNKISFNNTSLSAILSGQTLVVDSATGGNINFTIDSTIQWERGTIYPTFPCAGGSPSNYLEQIRINIDSVKAGQAVYLKPKVEHCNCNLNYEPTNYNFWNVLTYEVDYKDYANAPMTTIPKTENSNQNGFWWTNGVKKDSILTINSGQNFVFSSEYVDGLHSSNLSGLNNVMCKMELKVPSCLEFNTGILSDIKAYDGYGTPISPSSYSQLPSSPNGDKNYEVIFPMQTNKILNEKVEVDLRVVCNTTCTPSSLEWKMWFVFDATCTGISSNCWLPASPRMIFNPTVQGCQTTGIDELDDLELKIYPNPTESILNIESTKLGKVKIIDALGKVILEITSKQKLTTVDLSNVENGVYSVVFYSDSKKTTQVFIKK